MIFAWNGSFDWFCTSCECDGNVTARTQTGVLKAIKEAHTRGVVEQIRSGRLTEPCRGDKVTLFFSLDLNTRAIEGRLPKPSIRKLHRGHCSSAGVQPRITADDGAVTCRVCLARMQWEREYAERQERLEVESAE